MLADNRSWEDVCFCNVNVQSATRPAGRITDYRDKERATSGILFIRRGSASFWKIDQKSLTLHEGELLYIPKGFRYKMQFTAPESDYVLLNFNIVSADGAPLLLFDELSLLKTDAPVEKITQIMHSFDLCKDSKALSDTLRKKELLYRLFGIIYESIPAFSVKFEKYPQILAGTCLLERTYLENLPIAQFAAESNISISSFRSIFKKKYGMSPLHYRNLLRIERAAELLSDGTYNISEAAYACGFENVGYFCRYYKKATGETPSMTRARARRS